MLFKIALVLVAAVVLFLGYVATRDGSFVYERSGIIKASPEQIFPYISQFKLGGQWSPYEKDIEMPKTYGGTDGAVGSWMEFGPSKSGSGRIEILEVSPNEMVRLSLHMTAPFEAKNVVIYKLTPEAEGTRFSWTMEGHGGFLGKLMTTLIDCEKMVSGQFNEGIQNLKILIESQKHTK
ncbi:MAG TPA: SRPBCC family protein [Bdellovibrio sp.]|nr:SRPBCC family protein [Bdellovibrio sp.]